MEEQMMETNKAESDPTRPCLECACARVAAGAQDLE